jgi:hypothetical protein
MKPVFLIIGMVVFTVLLFISSFIHHPPGVDDAWIGEHAYWMSKLGYVKSELMHGITNQHIRNIVHHKFFTLLGSGFIYIFGFSLLTLQSVNLVAMICFFWVFTRYLTKNSTVTEIWTGILLMAVNALVFQYSLAYRPEIIVMTFGFISYIFLEKAIQSPDTKKFLAGSGLFAGLAAATHLNGLIYIMAGGLLLLLKKRPMHAVILGLCALPTFAIYFYDFTPEYNIAFWHHQIYDAPALVKKSEFPDFLRFLVKPFREQQRFFHSPKEISLTLLFIFSLIVSRDKAKTIQTPFIYFVLLVLSLMLISVHGTTKYLLLYLPVMMIIMAKSLGQLLAENYNKPISLKILFTPYHWAIFFVAIYVCTQSVHNILQSMEKYNPDANRQMVVTHIGNHTRHLNILAPMNFIFNEMDHFHRIQGDLGFSDLQKSGKPMYGKHLLQYADSLQLDYLIITKEYRKDFGMDTFPEQQRMLNGYRTITRNNDYEILKKTGSE